MIRRQGQQRTDQQALLANCAHAFVPTTTRMIILLKAKPSQASDTHWQGMNIGYHAADDEAIPK